MLMISMKGTVIQLDSTLYEREIRGFLDSEGKLHSYPARFKKQAFALCYLASKFEPGVRYTEKEVNQLLNKWHTFEDWATLRRDLCDRRFLGREPNGSCYWLEEEQPSLSSLGLE